MVPEGVSSPSRSASVVGSNDMEGTGEGARDTVGDSLSGGMRVFILQTHYHNTRKECKTSS
jgi:hypothetical protein